MAGGPEKFGNFAGDSKTFVFDISDILKKNNTKMRVTAPYSQTTIHH